MGPAMSGNCWSSFYDASKGSDPPRQTLVSALDAWEKFPGIAVDLGCGAGRDTLALLAAGWRVHALDCQTEALTRLDALVPAELRDRLTLAEERLEVAALPPADLVNASFALPFCAPGAFSGLWWAISACLRPGGLFSGQLFGDRDTWSADKGMTFHSAAGVEALLAGWERIILDECEWDGLPAVGPAKHWHVFHVVARRR